MSLQKNLIGISGIILAFSMVAFGQQPQPPTTTTPDGTLKRDRLERNERLRERRMSRHDGHGARGRRGPGLAGFSRELNLTEGQREQIRAITQRRIESTKVQRDELFKLREKRTAGTFSADDGARAKALRQEIRAAMDGIQAETAGVLTAEQKARSEELQKERKAKHELRMKERQELRNKPQ